MARFAISPLALGCAVLAVLPGCRQEKDDGLYEVDQTAFQKYDYQTVRERAKQLRPGMSKLEVVLLLGSPAQKEPTVWRYMQKRDGLLLPSEALHVHFQGNAVVDHKYVPIILGERLGD